jgi:prepilin-type processing-associated H-X9-DG protein
MKPRPANQRTTALTRVEVMTVIIVLVILVVVLSRVLHFSYSDQRDIRSEVQRINCISNLKQIGLAFRLWEGDHNDKYPMQISVTNGGAMELVRAGNVAACFQVMSNELSTPKILLCPADTRRIWATNFSADFDNSHISYFVGLDADETKPQMFLSGDDNFAIGGVPVKSGVLQLLTNAPVTWTKTRHKFVGNIGMADGHVEQITVSGLTNALIQTGVATNRLLIP